ncbi:Elongation factor Ts [Balamuthia mandrillaris]
MRAVTERLGGVGCGGSSVSPLMRGSAGAKNMYCPSLARLRLCRSRFYSTANVQVPLPLVKELRAETGAGVMDCRNALAESDNDLGKARRWLLQQTKKKMAKKQSRVAAEGLVAVSLSADAARGVMVELNCETDFVARVPAFQELALAAAKSVVETPRANVQKKKEEEKEEKGEAVCVEWLQNQRPVFVHSQKKGAATVEEGIVGLFGQVGEKMVLRRAVELYAAAEKEASSVVGGYAHNPPGEYPEVGTKAALVHLLYQPSSASSSPSTQRLQRTANLLARHIARTGPLYTSKEEVPSSVLQSWKEENAKRGNNSEEEAYRQLALMEQEIVIFPHEEEEEQQQNGGAAEEARNEPVKAFLSRQEEKLSGKIAVKQFVRWQAGEGIEKEEKDFAQQVQEEVARAAAAQS